VELAISDTGSGMPDEVRMRAFEPFFTTKEDGKGSGLGLSQVYGVVRQMGGTVTLDSGVAGGTTVHLYLPRTRMPLEEPALSQPPAPETFRSGARILLVEDDAGVRTTMAMCLQDAGYDAMETASGIEALARLDEASADLVVADYALPGLTGVELVHRIRQRWPSLPVLLITGRAPDGAIESVGDIEILRKPFRPAQLITCIKLALQNRNNFEENGQ
jgi:CheY-like chemotaxis protein